MEKTRYSEEPEPVLVQSHAGWIKITVACNAVQTGDDPVQWEADVHTFWEAADAIDVASVVADPEAYLHYIPRQVRASYRQKAQGLLDAWRQGRPVVPVPSFREGAAVLCRTEDKAMFSAAMARGRGLPAYELADGEIVALTHEQMQAIYDDVESAEIAAQTGKQIAWAAIDSADSTEAMEEALDGFAKVLNQYVAKGHELHP